MKDIRMEIGRVVTESFYDTQQNRISSMNRLRDILWKRNEGLDLRAKISKDEIKITKEYNDENIVNLLKKMVIENKLSPSEMEYITNVTEIFRRETDSEKFLKKNMEAFVLNEEIWKEFLSKVKGIGIIHTANLLKFFGYCETFDNIGKVWAYAGMAVVDGKAPKLTKGEDVKYSPACKTLCWKISDSFIKHRTPFYRDIYDKTKEAEKLRTDENKPKNLLHADLRARRKAVKMFLSHYWACCRELRGLSVRSPWVIEYGGHQTFIPWREAIKDS